MKNNQCGRSMIEMLGVLSIIGVLSVGGFSMVKKMQNSYDTNKIMDEISTFLRKGRTVVREYDSTDGNLNAYVKKGRAVPEGVTLDDDNSKFVGTTGIEYSLDLPSGSDNFLFKMTISAVPEEICMQITTADWGNVASSGFKGLKVGSGDMAAEPLSLGEAADVCADNATITMYYR